ncbi:uncharacterized membrane protein (UPF0136 family) [Bradyrhizobium sp. JR1.7]|uniref:hypothetical protein n=1 Tax=unclassified Bradyrhizobium TaxID=2631580 RepID=UPI00339679A3
MLILCVTIAFVAGLLLGATLAWDKAFEAGKSWGLQVAIPPLNDQTVIDRVRAVM